MSGKPNKILLVVSSLLPGGAERATLGLADYLVSNGYEVHLFIARNSRTHKQVYSVPSTIICHYISVGVDNKLIRPLLNILLLRNLLCKVQFEWVVSLGSQYKTLSASGCFRRAKTLLSERNYPITFYSEEERVRVEKIYSRATKVVFQTQESMNCFNALSKDKCILIPNAVRDDLPRWRGHSSKTIVFVGRLVDQKNPMVLIEAFRKFRSTHDSWKLDVYGDGPLKQAMLKEIEGQGLSDCVEFHGNISAVADVMSQGGMYVSTSDYEGISNSMLEALAIGIPAICTDCAGGGARLAIEDGRNGFLVPCGDADRIAEAMARLADDAMLAERLSENARRESKRFSPSRIYPLWVEAMS